MRASCSSVLLVMGLLLVQPAANAQVCQGDLTLTTQAEVDAFNCAEVLGHLSIQFSDALVNLSGLSELTSVGGGLAIWGNAALTSLDGLGSLTSIGERLLIYQNDVLGDIGALESLASVGGYISISRNSLLANIDGLSGLNIVADLYIAFNGTLSDIDGLAGVTAVTGILKISGNDSLDDISGLSNLTSVGNLTVGGILESEGNASLTNLEGLGQLTSVAGNIDIYGNLSLANLDELAGLTSVGGDLYVRHNASLGACTVGLAGFLLNGDLGGTPYIHDNATGCNSYQEVISGTVDAEDEATPLVTGLAAPYPNPTAGTATLAFTLAEPADVRLTVYDALGRRVAVLAEGPEAAGVHEAALTTGLPAGTYVVRFTAGEQTWTERVTVVR